MRTGLKCVAVSSNLHPHAVRCCLNCRHGWLSHAERPSPHASQFGYETRCAAVVQVSDFAARRLKPISLPIVLGSTFELDDCAHGARLHAKREQPYADGDGYVYGRWGSPTNEGAARQLAALEGIGPADEGGCMIFSSGAPPPPPALTLLPEPNWPLPQLTSPAERGPAPAQAWRPSRPRSWPPSRRATTWSCPVRRTRTQRPPCTAAAPPRTRGPPPGVHLAPSPGRVQRAAHAAARVRSCRSRSLRRHERIHEPVHDAVGGRVDPRRRDRPQRVRQGDPAQHQGDERPCF